MQADTDGAWSVIMEVQIRANSPSPNRAEKTLLRDNPLGLEKRNQQGGGLPAWCQCQATVPTCKPGPQGAPGEPGPQGRKFMRTLVKF